MIAPVLLAAFLSLYFFPGHTEEYFAWPIVPELTSIVMGAGYGAGAYFFYRVVTVDRWHRVHVLFPGIAVFTLAMAVATVRHWEAFTVGHPSTWLWVGLYVVTPVLIPLLWWYNGRIDDGSTLDGRIIPLPIRFICAAVGAMLTIALVALFTMPEFMIDRWSWSLSPLTARVLVGWGLVFAVVNVAVAFERRWTAATIPIESLVIWFTLVLIGFPRRWGDLDPDNPLLWLLVGGIVAYLVGLIALYLAMERYHIQG